MRLPDHLRLQAATGISIHAPLAGCDAGHLRRERAPVYFNPRTPCGVRLSTSAATTSAKAFQSTHPLRGATTFVAFCTVRSLISIHAPLAGCDGYDFHSALARQRYFNPRTPCGVRRGVSIVAVVGRAFQSTHPLRGATTGLIYPDFVTTFQSTHPLRGATFRFTFFIFVFIISIHAPLAGCDDTDHLGYQLIKDFNPRTPCGVRHSLL